MVDAEQHQWRLERHRRERICGKAVASASVVASRYHGDAGGEAAHRLPEVPAVELSGSELPRCYHGTISELPLGQQSCLWFFIVELAAPQRNGRNLQYHCPLGDSQPL